MEKKVHRFLAYTVEVINSETKIQSVMNFNADFPLSRV